MTGKELKALRTTLNLTQEALAERLGVRKNTVWRWEAGQRRVPEMAARLVHYLAKEREPKSRKPPSKKRTTDR